MKKALFIVIVAFTASCKPQVKTTPAGVINKDTMIDILVDIHIAEAAMPAMQIYGEKMNEVALDHYDHIFKLHNVKEKEFKTSYNHYINDPKQFRDMYDEVIKKIDKLKTSELPE